MKNQHMIDTCLHLMNGFICSEGKHQNHPCPYKNDIYNCVCSIKVIKEMVEQLNEQGFISITYERK